MVGGEQQADFLEPVEGNGFNGLCGSACILEAEAELVEHGLADELILRGLAHERQTLGALTGQQGGDIPAIEGDGASTFALSVALCQAGEHVKKRRLS